MYYESSPTRRLGACVEHLLKADRKAQTLGKILPDAIVSGLCCDSSNAKSGDIFFCKGRAFRPEYLQDALNKGVLCVVCSKNMTIPNLDDESAPLFIVTENVRAAMSCLSAFFYGFPFKKLTTVAVTGTKGKTGTSQMLKDVLNGKNGIRAEILRDIYHGPLTTPESPDLHKAAYHALKNGATHLICEISSQALKDLRTHGITFDIGCFLNFSPDHISPAEHSCTEEYLLCKASLFLNCARAVINSASEQGKLILEICKKFGVPALTFSCDDLDSDITAKNVVCSKGGCSFTVSDNRNKTSERIYLSAFGSYNAENALCAYAVAKLMDIPSADVFRALATSKTCGRGEMLTSLDGKLRVIVDYAHNGLSFRRFLKDTKALFPDRRLTAVFGCPGEKAFIRRRQLPAEALKYADSIILCEDDSGCESFDSIAHEMLSNIDLILRSYPQSEKICKRAAVSVCKSREKAIENAIFSAYESGEKSVIALLGRGEDTIMKTQSGNVICKSDREMAQRAISRIDKRIAVSKAFGGFAVTENKRLIISLPKNRELLRASLLAFLPIRGASAALYCDARFAPLIRDLCYENGRLCHVCDYSSDFVRECEYCFRAGAIPVFLDSEDNFPSLYPLIELLSFDTAVYISEKMGILIDGKTYVSALSYENALILSEKTHTRDLSLLTSAISHGAREAILLNGSQPHSLAACLCGGSIYGTSVTKAT